MELDLFDGAPEPTREITHREKWLAFHHKNHEVYESLVGLARKLKARGHDHYGIGSLFEVVRFHRAMETQDAPFKLNNNYRAYYARLMMIRCPDLDGFFEVRVQKSANRTARNGRVDLDADWRNDPFWLSLQDESRTDAE